MKVDLPNGAWAAVRDPEEIPRKAARTFRKTLYRLTGSVADIDPALGEDDKAREAGRALLTGDGMDGIEDMTEAMVLAIVSEWSYGDVTPDVLDTVPDAAVDAIYECAVAGNYIEKLMPDFGVSPDPDSPTKPSAP